MPLGTPACTSYIAVPNHRCGPRLALYSPAFFFNWKDQRQKWEQHKAIETERYLATGMRIFSYKRLQSILQSTFAFRIITFQYYGLIQVSQLNKFQIATGSLKKLIA